MGTLAERRALAAARQGWSTPSRLKMFLWLALAGAAAIFLVGEASLQSARVALRAVGTDAAQGILASQQIQAELADLDTQAARMLLVTDRQADVALQLFTFRRSSLTRGLVDAAQGISYGDAERRALLLVSEHLSRYLDAVGEARLRAARGDGAGALEAYRLATEIMHGRAMPAAEQLGAINEQAMGEIYRASLRRSLLAEVAALAAGGAALAVLLWAQVFLARRTRRLLNAPLLLATLLAAGFSGYLYSRIGEARDDLQIARMNAFEAAHQLWQARAVAYDAAGDQSRALLDPQGADRHRSAFDGKMNRLLLDRSTTGGLLNEARKKVGAFASEQEAHGEAVGGLRKFWGVDDEVRRAARGSGPIDQAAARQDAVRRCLDDGVAAFDAFDARLQRLLSLNVEVFEQLMAEGDAGLKRAEMLDPLLALALAALAWLGLRGRLREYELAGAAAQDAADEEGAHLGDELGRLARLAHRLDQVRQRVQLAAHQPDDELVVGGVEAVARQTDVVGQLLLPVGHAQGGVLAHDGGLLLVVEAVEGADAAQRVPDVPAEVRVEHVLDGAAQEPVLQVGLVTRAVGAPQHGHLGAEVDLVLGEEGPHLIDKKGRVLAPGEEPEAVGILGVGVDDGGNLVLVEAEEEVAAGALVLAAEGQELHEQAAVELLPFTVAAASVFVDVDGRQARARIARRLPCGLGGVG